MRQFCAYSQVFTTRRFNRVYPVFLTSCFLALASCPAAAQPGTKLIKPNSGNEMCSALTPADFIKAGVPVSPNQPPPKPAPKGAIDTPNTANCGYESKAGPVEFDIYFPAGANAQEVRNTERAAVADSGGKYEPVRLGDADYAQISLTTYAQIIVRKGKAVFGIYVPKTSNSRQQLLALSQLLLVRLKQ